MGFEKTRKQEKEKQKSKEVLNGEIQEKEAQELW